MAKERGRQIAKIWHTNYNTNCNNIVTTQKVKDRQIKKITWKR